MCGAAKPDSVDRPTAGFPAASARPRAADMPTRSPVKLPGPVVTAMPFTDPEEIIPRANNSDYGLAAAVWTRDIGKAHRMAELLRAGTVWINCYNIFDAALPFGGYKQSGWGREMGHDVLNLYTQTKAVCPRIV